MDMETGQKVISHRNTMLQRLEKKLQQLIEIKHRGICYFEQE